MLRLVSGKWHLSDVSNHVLVRDLVVDKLRFIVCVEDVEEL